MYSNLDDEMQIKMINKNFSKINNNFAINFGHINKQVNIIILF